MRGAAGVGPHLIPLCTTRFLQFLQQEQAWLHSKISGGSILLNSWSSRPSWDEEWETVVSVWCPPQLPRTPRTSEENPSLTPNPETGKLGWWTPHML